MINVTKGENRSQKRRKGTNMKLEDLQFGLKWVSIGMRLVIAALVGTIAAAILADIGGQKFWVLVLVLMLLCAVAGTLATILGAANLRKVNRNYRLAFWAVLAVVVLSFSIGALEDVRVVLRNGMAAAVVCNIVQGTNEFLKQRGCDELVQWGRWAARWTVAVAVVSILYLLFEEVNSSELQTICLVVGVILGVLFLIFYFGFLKDASAEVSAWETLPGEDVPRQADQA